MSRNLNPVRLPVPPHPRSGLAGFLGAFGAGHKHAGAGTVRERQTLSEGSTSQNPPQSVHRAFRMVAVYGEGGCFVCLERTEASHAP